jgi:hypothetical protein
MFGKCLDHFNLGSVIQGMLCDPMYNFNYVSGCTNTDWVIEHSRIKVFQRVREAFVGGFDEGIVFHQSYRTVQPIRSSFA